MFAQNWWHRPPGAVTDSRGGIDKYGRIKGKGTRTKEKKIEEKERVPWGEF